MPPGAWARTFCSVAYVQWSRITSEFGFEVMCIYMRRGVERLGLAPAGSAEHHPAAAGLRLGGQLWGLESIMESLSVYRSRLILEPRTSTEVRSLVQKLLMIYTLAGYADSAQNVMGPTLRGVGRLTS